MALGSQREQRPCEGGPGVAASARQQAAELAPLRRARDGQAADGAREPHLHLAACHGVLLCHAPQAAAQLLPLKQASPQALWGHRETGDRRTQGQVTLGPPYLRPLGSPYSCVLAACCVLPAHQHSIRYSVVQHAISRAARGGASG